MMWIAALPNCARDGGVFIAAAHALSTFTTVQNALIRSPAATGLFPRLAALSR